MNDKNEQLHAVIYARFSSHSQRETSIEQQIQECREFAKSQNIKIVGEYSDRAITGKTDRRPEFQRMIKDSAKKRFQYVIVYTLDRFSRNRYDSATYKTALKKNGVRVLSAKENITETPEGIILESVLEGMAEYYSAELSRKIRRGMEANARKCMVNHGNLPLGYKKGADGKYAIEEEGAKIIVYIFEAYDGGLQMQAIADALNAKGKRTTAGKPFQKSTISGILRNDSYIGVYKYGSIRIENGIPSIISEELFRKVQKMLESNRKYLKRKAEDPHIYLMTGKLFCGLCESPMVGDSGTSRNGAKYHYYSCIEHKNRRNCSKKAVSQEKIEKEILDYTLNHVLKEDVIEAIADAIIERQRKEEENSLLETLKTELNDVNRKLENINNAIANGIFSSSTKEKLDELEEQRADLLEQIDIESVEKPHLEKEQIVFWLNRFRACGDSAESCTQIIDTFINSVYVFEDHLLIAYNFGSDKKIIGLDEIIKTDYHAEISCSEESAMVELKFVYPNIFIVKYKF